MNAGREGGDGLGGGVDVGGLGVVVVLDAVDGGHELEPMLDGLELLDGAANCLGRHAGEAGRDDSGQHILDIVRALERNSGERHDLLDRRRLWPRDRRRSHPQAMRPARPDARLRTSRPWRWRGRRPRRRGYCRRSAPRSRSHSARRRCAPWPRIVLEAAVAVEMVGRDVEDDGDVGMELDGAFKLEAGDLEDRPGVGSAFVDEPDDGHADVAADEGGKAGSRREFRRAGRWWWFCRWSR